MFKVILALFALSLSFLVPPMLSKFGAPKPGGDQDMGKMMKLAQRVEKAMADHLAHLEPKQLDPRLILVAPLNRDSAPPNQMHVHQGILNSFKNKGFDRGRPAIGICIEFKSEEGEKCSSSTT